MGETISFCRTLTETRVFLKKLSSQIGKIDWPSAYRLCEPMWQYIIKVKLGRPFLRDKQAYRKKGRGLLRKPVGRPRTVVPRPSTLEEYITNEKISWLSTKLMALGWQDYFKKSCNLFEINF